MINLFEFASNDKSLQYLASIFGYMNGVIPNTSGPGEAAISGTSITLLGTMFKTFNSVILAIAALMIVYITVIGVLKTAHEGEMLGKGKWSSIWIPIRIVLGVASLVPTGSGYSGLQLVMMWVIVQAVGAADFLWSTALSYVDIAGSPTAQITIPNVGVYETMSGVFQSLLCEASARETRQDPSASEGSNYEGYYCSNSANSGSTFCKSTFPAPIVGTTATYTMGPNGTCGKLTYCNYQKTCGTTDLNATPQTVECAACQGQILALQTVLPVLAQIATQFVQDYDYTYKEFSAYSFNDDYKTENNPNWNWIYDYCTAKGISLTNCCVPYKDSPNNTCVSSEPFPSVNNEGDPTNASDSAVKDIYWPYGLGPVTGNEDFIATAVSEYMEKQTAAVTDFIVLQAQDPNNLEDETLEEAQRTGWILAGGYYYYISGQNNNDLEDAVPTFKITSENPTMFPGSPLYSSRTNYTAAAALIDLLGSSTLEGGSPKQTAAFDRMTDSMITSISQSFTVSGDKGTSPLTQIQQAGKGILMVVQMFYGTLVLATVATGMGGNISIFVLGTGATNPVGPGAELLYFVIMPALYGLMGIMTALGGTLAVYVPLIPFVVFSFGAIGWLISTVEAMIAGPLLALGILNPNSEHELLGSASGALMALLNIFLRPSLMIFGLMAAMLLASVVVEMINYAFWGVVASAISGGGVTKTLSATELAQKFVTQPLQFVIFLTAYIGILVAALNKCFSAIHVIPERVISWIGGQGSQYGEEQAAGEMKGSVQSATSSAKGAGEAAGKQAEKHATRKGGQEVERREAEKAKLEEAKKKNNPQS